MNIEQPPAEKPYDKPEGERRGLIIVNTGDGKGKTTAAIGLAVRAIGRGRTPFEIWRAAAPDGSTFMSQFMYRPGQASLETLSAPSAANIGSGSAMANASLASFIGHSP